MTFKLREYFAAAAIREVANIICLYRINADFVLPSGKEGEEGVKIIIPFYRALVDRNTSLSRYQMLKVNNVRFVLRNILRTRNGAGMLI